ncbi:uncharacterized protein LOC130654298 [Hydractinia symbiolongicarpus]|uniref:uncharacterized protein LOC130654298 n=1 Tax=Hydractinia symbiolongicarpus TaxID=13093 RepID=UPI00254C596D|nr:uncharacterized protein LOC130654298 [Hydractinia symbiolongicarpus]
MRQPATNQDLADMVMCSVGVQTSCPNSPIYTHTKVCALVEDTRPSHFNDIHITKLEDTFSKRQKPDEIQLQILAMECNLLYTDVKDWFKARRIKWIQDLVRDDSCKNDTNNNNIAPNHKLKSNSKKLSDSTKMTAITSNSSTCTT